jgi:hypothetical protein
MVQLQGGPQFYTQQSLCTTAVELLQTQAFSELTWRVS